MDFTLDELKALELERTLLLVQKYREGASLSQQDRALVEEWLVDQKKAATKDLQAWMEGVAKEARDLGLIVRCESHGVLAMVHPKHATEAEKQPALPLPSEANGGELSRMAPEGGTTT